MYGIHITFDEGILNNIKRAHNFGCSIIQLFVSDFMEKDELIDKILEMTKEYKMKIICHASFIINIATNWFKNAWHIQELLSELRIAKKMYDAPLVLHMGKQKALTKEIAYNNMITSLTYVIKKTHQTILIETPAGQGTEMCYDLEDLSYFFKKVINNPILKNRIGICLDTCHIFVAKYDISSKMKSKIFLELFDKLIGIQYIKCVHLNDSYNECGSKLDRHNDFGKGFIGREAMDYLFKFFKEKKIPIIFETTFKTLEILFS
jgi:deoxyribonuclease-4